MKWNEILKLEKSMTGFSFETKYDYSQDRENVEELSGSGIYDFEWGWVHIKWDMKFDVKDDNITMYKPEVESVSVQGVDVSFADSEDTENWDIEDKDIETDEVTVEFEGWSGDIGEGWSILPIVEFEISKFKEDIILENVVVIFS